MVSVIGGGGVFCFELVGGGALPVCLPRVATVLAGTLAYGEFLAVEIDVLVGASLLDPRGCRVGISCDGCASGVGDGRR